MADGAGTSNNELQENDSPQSSLRRTFLEILSGVGVLLGLGALAKWEPSIKRTQSLVRPPGGQSEVRFLSLCVKCDRCQEVCPTHVISPDDVRDGIAAARTPKLDFRQGYCNFCMKCVELCPTNALEKVDPKKSKVGVALVQREFCIPWQWGGCTICIERCPVKAITLDEAKRPIVDEIKCNGCGLCERICPAEELRSYTAGQQRGIVIVSPDCATSSGYRAV